MSIDYAALTPIQQKAYDKSVKPEKKVTRIGGYAGTGKTTVMACVAEQYGGDAVVLSPTNKAAQVLRDKNISQAQTIHSCLYQPHEVEVHEKDEWGETVYIKCPKTGTQIPKVIGHKITFALNANDDLGLPDTALVDEASMVDSNVYSDLLYVFPNVILFGDPFQLPPVATKEGALDMEPLDVEMTEVHRVALENPITKYATRIRDNKEPRLTGVYDELKPVGINDADLWKKIVEGEYQAICYTNRMRHHINKMVRQELGYKMGTYNKGEPIICLENIRVLDGGYDPFADQQEKIMIAYNGMMGSLDRDFESTNKTTDFQMANLPFVDPEVYPGNVPVLPFWNCGFWEHWPELTRKTPRKKIRGHLFDFGYCLTAHKAQGSEFDNVVVFDERPKLTKIPQRELQRWYYTAVTRAKKNLMVVKF